MAGFILNKRTLGLKLEGTAYTAESLAVADFDQRAYNINYTTDVPMYDRKLARGHYSHDTAIAGRRSGTVSFSVDMYQADTVTSAPAYFDALRACGMQLYSGGSGTWLKPDADYSNVPCTIEVVERDEGTSPSQLVIKFRGCMGNAKLSYDNVGTPVRIDFEFTGVLDSITDRAYGSLLTPTGFGTVLPEAVLAITTTWISQSMKHSKMSIDLGNEVEMFTDPSKEEGYEGAHIVGRNPILEIDPDMTLIATRDYWGSLKANTTGAFQWKTNRFTIDAPAAQLETPYNPGEREGHVSHNLTFGLKANLGNDELVIAQGLQT